MRFRHIRRGGAYFRVADPAWAHPLEGHYSAVEGGRWNAPATFPVVYLCSNTELARSFVLAKYDGLPYAVLDLEPDRRPVLVETKVDKDSFVDVVTDKGCLAAGLPETYPSESDGSLVGWNRCRAIGREAWNKGDPGIVCRSATARPKDSGDELAWFERSTKLSVAGRRTFDEWFT